MSTVHPIHVGSSCLSYKKFFRWLLGYNSIVLHTIIICVIILNCLQLWCENFDGTFVKMHMITGFCHKQPAWKWNYLLSFKCYAWRPWQWISHPPVRALFVSWWAMISIREVSTFDRSQMVPFWMLKHLSKCLCRASIDHLKNLVSEFGTDCWWTLPMSKLLPPHVISKVRNILIATK